MSISSIRQTLADSPYLAPVRAFAAVLIEKEISFLAASVAFFAFFSLIPALLIALVVGTIVGGEEFAEFIVSFVGLYLSEEGEGILADVLTQSTGRLGASAIGLVTLLWSALKVFRAFDIAFDRIYEADEMPSLVKQLVDGIIVLLAIGGGIALIVLLRLIVAFADIGFVPYLDVLGWLFLWLGLLVFLLPLYWVMPPVRVSLLEILPGTLLAVVGWVLLQSAFELYTLNAAQYQAFGLVGVVLLFMLWLYFGAALLLVGATLNAYLAGVFDDEPSSASS